MSDMPPLANPSFCLSRQILMSHHHHPPAADSEGESRPHNASSEWRECPVKENEGSSQTCKGMKRYLINHAT